MTRGMDSTSMTIQAARTRRGISACDVFAMTSVESRPTSSSVVTPVCTKPAEVVLCRPTTRATKTVDAAQHATMSAHLSTRFTARLVPRSWGIGRATRTQ
jgi:hypothetical protein